MEDDILIRKIGELVGEASTCWDNLEGAGVFESEKALEVADKLVKLAEDYKAGRLK